jgi:uncharacterized protein YkwD
LLEGLPSPPRGEGRVRGFVALLVALTGTLFPGRLIADDFDALRGAFLVSLNAERAREKASALSLSQPLNRLAQQFAEEAGKRGDPDVSTVVQSEVVRLAEKAGYAPKAMAEVFARADGTVEDVIGFLREHGGATWRSLTGPDFRDLGVGVAAVGDVPLYVFLIGISWEEYAAGRAQEYRDLNAMRRLMIARVNAERRRQRLPVMTENPALDRVAQGHAEDMLKRSYYGHKNPEGVTVRERALAGGYRMRFVGENIASGQPTVDEVMDGWMASDEHRPNILSKVFSEAGFGLAIGKNRGGFQVIWVQVFARPRGVRPNF